MLHAKLGFLCVLCRAKGNRYKHAVVAFFAVHVLLCVFVTFDPPPSTPTPSESRFRSVIEGMSRRRVWCVPCMVEKDRERERAEEGNALCFRFVAGRQRALYSKGGGGGGVRNVPVLVNVRRIKRFCFV